MAILCSTVFSDAHPKMNDRQLHMVALAETAIDALLQLQGGVSIQLACMHDAWIRQELEDRYRRAGWYVKSIQAADSSNYFIDVFKPKSP